MGSSPCFSPPSQPASTQWGFDFGVADANDVGVLYKDVKIEFKRRVDEDLILVTKDNRKVSKQSSSCSLGERICPSER